MHSAGKGQLYVVEILAKCRVKAKEMHLDRNPENEKTGQRNSSAFSR